MNIRLLKWRFAAAFTLFMVGLFFTSSAYASETDGTIDATNKYAWSENIGWINFGTGVGAGDIHITDAGITGYAWSDTTGWINMNPTSSGVTVAANGDLGGFAWGEGTGYIDFSAASISSTGIFQGTATSTVTGTITFDCTNCLVETDYRPANFRVGGGGGGGGRTREDPPVVPPPVDGTTPPPSDGTHPAAEEPAVTTPPRPSLRLMLALRLLFAWMDPVDYQLTTKNQALERHFQFILSMKRTMNYYASSMGFFRGYLYNKPDQEPLKNVAELTKGIMISFSGCYSESQLERAIRHDRVDNPNYWWAGYWHFLDPLMQRYFGSVYLLWAPIDRLNILEVVDVFVLDYCQQQEDF